jgi:hypothetical protein
MLAVSYKKQNRIQGNEWTFHLESNLTRTPMNKRQKRKVGEVIDIINIINPLNERKRAFENIKERIAVISEEEDEEDFTYKSSDYALYLVFSIIKKGYLLSRGQIIKPLIAVDGQGGLKFDWRAPNKEVRLFIPTSDARTPYLYYREGANDDIINAPDGETLAKWLTWLAE